MTTDEKTTILSNEHALCQQVGPQSLDYLDLDTQVLLTAENIMQLNRKTSCSIRLDYNGSTPFRHYNFHPSERKERQGLIYQLAQDLKHFPEFLDWTNIINPFSECIVDFANNIHAPKLRNLADIPAEAVTWLWHPYIPYAKITSVEGDPGEGKSHICLAIATPITLGKPISPGAKPVPLGTVLIISAEDGLGDTVRPRLERLGANISQVFVIDGLFSFDEKGVALLENYIDRVRPSLVIIDPLIAYMGRELSSNQGNHVRAVMALLNDLAQKYGPAILTVRHLNKSPSGKAIYRGAGSIDFTAAARSVLLVGSDPETQEHAIVHLKHNLSEQGKSINFSLNDDYFTWGGESDMTAEDILASASQSNALGKAKEFLSTILESGPMKWEEIKKEADSRGEFKERTLKTAKANLGVVSYNVPEKGKRGAGPWYWRLPGQLPIKGAKDTD